MLRRTPSIILTAHRMDPARRELYVEGVKDRVFLHWLTHNSLHDRVTVQLIDAVDMPDCTEGGNRGRLKAFLEEVQSSGMQIRGLIDSDHSVYLSERLPGNAWLTDYRDLEGYVLSVENVDSALRLGYGIDGVDAAHIFAAMRTSAQYIAAIRLASNQHGWALPVSDCQLSKFVFSDECGGLKINKDRMLSSLLQSAGISLKERSRIEEQIALAALGPISQNSLHACHGKDAMKLLTIQFRKVGAGNVSDVTPVVWATFDRNKMDSWTNLKSVYTYLTSDGMERPPG